MKVRLKSGNKLKLKTTAIFNDYHREGLVLNLDAGNSSSYPGSGTTWTDLSDSGNNATLTNGPTYSSDDGGVIVFDGSNDYATLTSTISVTDFTYEAWVYHTPPNAASDYGYFFTGGSNGLAVSEGGTDSSLSLSELYYYNGSAVVSLGYTLPSSQWVHLVAVCDGTADSIKIYINGSLVSTTSITTLQTSITQLFRYQTATTNYLNGKVSIVRIYNDQLTASEVTKNYNAFRGRYGL